MLKKYNKLYAPIHRRNHNFKIKDRRIEGRERPDYIILIRLNERGKDNEDHNTCCDAAFGGKFFYGYSQRDALSDNADVSDKYRIFSSAYRFAGRGR